MKFSLVKTSEVTFTRSDAEMKRYRIRPENRVKTEEVLHFVSESGKKVTFHADPNRAFVWSILECDVSAKTRDAVIDAYINVLLSRSDIPGVEQLYKDYKNSGKSWSDEAAMTELRAQEKALITARLTQGFVV